jgi:LCP family protein required for cell wall assembly
VNILVVVNPKTKQILLLNTPRDYWVPNPAGKGKRDKLTHCGLYGPKCSMEALGDLYNLKVDYYAQINFTGFDTLVDAVGGVTVNADHSFTAESGMKFEKGENYLNGKEALWFARERHHVKGGDNGRGKNQMKVITAIIQKATSGTTIISNYASILKSLEGMFRTTISMDGISRLAKMQLEDMASWNVQSFAVTGKGGSEKNYSSPGHKAYVMYPDDKMVAFASTLAERVIAGETLSADDLKYK